MIALNAGYPAYVELKKLLLALDAGAEQIRKPTLPFADIPGAATQPGTMRLRRSVRVTVPDDGHPLGMQLRTA